MRSLRISVAVFLTSLILTYPLVLNFDSEFPSDLGDGSKYLWNLWWMRQALLVERTNPFYTTYLYHPHGTGLVFDVLTPFWGFISLPLQALFGLIPAYNLLVFIAFLLSFWGMFLLVLRLTKYQGGAFLSGIFYAFSPYVFSHLRGHLNLIQVWFFPWLLYFLLLLKERPSLKRMFLLACLFIVSLLTDFYYAFYGVGLTILFLLSMFFLDSKRRGALFTQGVLLFVVLAVIVLPFYLGYQREQEVLAPIRIEEYEQYSADLLSYFVPFVQNPFFAPLIQTISERFTAGTTEGTLYIGFVPLFLAILGIVGRTTGRKSQEESGRFKFFLLLLLVISFLFSLGPTLTILGKDYPVVLPFSWLMDGGVLSHLRVSSRFGILTLFGIYVFSGLGAKSLLKNRIAILPYLVIFALWFIESASFPIPLERPQASVFYDTIASDPEHFAVLPLPLEFPSDETRAVYGQTVHGKPLLGGIVARPPERRIEEYRTFPFLGSILAFQERGQPLLATSVRGETIENLRQSVIDLNIKYILVYKEYRGWEELHAYTGYVLGKRHVFEDDILVAYQVD